MGSLDGKIGLIVGVANKRSLAWAIAQAAAAEGARLVLTYQERFKEHTEELAATLSPVPQLLQCDVQDDAQIDAVFAQITTGTAGSTSWCTAWPSLRATTCRIPSPTPLATGSRPALDISAYSLIALARGARPLFAARGGGAIVTLSFLGSDRVFPNYNVMGVAKAALESTVRYLAADLGPQNVRVNAVSAGPVKTLAAAGIGGFSTILGVVREKAPLRRAIDSAEVGDAAVVPARPRRPRHHR